jgi:hypothetical protein
MERARSPFLPAARLQCFPGRDVATGGHSHHLLHQRTCTRACHGVHHEEAAWVRRFRSVVADATCGHAA